MSIRNDRARDRDTHALEPLAAGSPFLTHIGIHDDRTIPGVRPFDLPIPSAGLDTTLTTPVTFLVGENGSGKSTLLEAPFPARRS